MNIGKKISQLNKYEEDLGVLHTTELQSAKTLLNHARATDWNEEQIGQLTKVLDVACSSATQLRKLSKRYAATKEYFLSIVDNNPDIIFTTDLNGCFTSVNSAFVRYF